MDDEDVIRTTLPHSDFGDPECCGCLNGIVHGDRAVVVCNECMTVLWMCAASELSKMLSDMELSLDAASAMCPHCGAVSLFPGLAEILAYVCKECGLAVMLTR